MLSLAAWADEVSRTPLIICIRTTSAGRGWAACHEQDLSPGVCEATEFFLVTVMALKRRQCNDVIALLYFSAIGRQTLPSFKPSNILHYDHGITISWKALI